MHHERHATNSSTAAAADIVWREMAQMLGTRWGDQFGATPTPQWRESISTLRQDQVRGALTKIRSAPMPYAGWLPTLPEFMTMARAINPMPKAPPKTHKQTWLDAANLLFYRWMFDEIMSEKRMMFSKDSRSIPDGEIDERRTAVRELAQAFELMERENDPAATRERFSAAFKDQMKLIPARNQKAAA